MSSSDKTKSVTHALVCDYRGKLRGSEEVVTVSRIDDFIPQHTKDFDMEKKYKLWNDDRSEDSEIYILRLGSKYIMYISSHLFEAIAMGSGHTLV